MLLVKVLLVLFSAALDQSHSKCSSGSCCVWDAVCETFLPSHGIIPAELVCRMEFLPCLPYSFIYLSIWEGLGCATYRWEVPVHFWMLAGMGLKSAMWTAAWERRCKKSPPREPNVTASKMFLRGEVICMQWVPQSTCTFGFFMYHIQKINEMPEIDSSLSVCTLCVLQYLVNFVFLYFCDSKYVFFE